MADDFSSGFSRGLSIVSGIQDIKKASDEKKAAKREALEIEGINKAAEEGGLDAAVKAAKSKAGLEHVNKLASTLESAQKIQGYESPKDKRTGDLLAKAVESGIDISGIDPRAPGSGDLLQQKFREKELSKQAFEIETKAAEKGVPPINDETLDPMQKTKLYQERLAEKANLQSGVGKSEASIALVSSLPEFNAAIDSLLEAIDSGQFPTDPVTQGILDSGNYYLATGNPQLQKIMSSQAFVKQKFMFSDAGKALTTIEEPIVSASMKFGGKDLSTIKRDLLRSRNVVNSKGQLFGADDSQIYGTVLAQDPTTGKQYKIPRNKIKEAQAMGGKIMG